MTLGVDFKYRDVERGEDVVRLTIWDTAGQDHYRHLADQFYRRAQGVLLVYDVGDAQTLEGLRGFIDEMRMKCPHGHVPVLIGNKIDIPENERAVATEAGMTFAQRNGIPLFYETSARDGQHVDDAFLALCDHCITTMETQRRVQRNQKCFQCNNAVATCLCSVCHNYFCHECQLVAHDPLDNGTVHRAYEEIEKMNSDGSPQRPSMRDTRFVPGAGQRPKPKRRFPC